MKCLRCQEESNGVLCLDCRAQEQGVSPESASGVFKEIIHTKPYSRPCRYCGETIVFVHAGKIRPMSEDMRTVHKCVSKNLYQSKAGTQKPVMGGITHPRTIRMRRTTTNV